MKSIFVKLYLDEDVSILLAELLRSHGFDALTVREATQLGKNHEEQLAYAVGEARAILNHNRADLEELAQHYFATERIHCDIILATRHSPCELLRRLLIIINNLTSDEIQNQLLYI